MTDFPFDAVLFDCDGVLVDSEPITSRVLTDMLNELGWGITHAETMQIFTGKAVKDELPLIEARTGATITQDWFDQFRQRRNDALDRDLLEIPGAPDAVRALHQALDGRIAVASGADRRKVELQLAKVGIADCFNGRVFSGHEMPRSKPFPDVYLAAAQALGVSDRAIIFRHMLPNAVVATLTFLPFILCSSITTLTSLDFLGFGLPLGSPSLGELLLQGKNNLQAPWLGITAFLSVAVLLSLLIFIGEAVRDAFDPDKAV